MSEKIVTISPSATGFGSFVLGLGAGYTLAPRKYTLERLLMQNEDSFERNFPSNVMKKATPNEKQSLNNIKDAALLYKKSGDDILKEKIIPNAKLWHKLVSEVSVNDSFTADVELKKNVYLKALEDSKYNELKGKLKQALEAVKLNPKDSNAILEMKAAARDFAEAQIAVSTPANNYKKSRMDFRAAREEAILQLPDKGCKITAQWEKVRRALSDRANIMYEKLATLSSNENLKNDYSALKKYIPKARTYSALMGGVLAGIAGVIVGVYSLNKFGNAA